MEVFRTGQYDISDLERLQEIQPLDYAKKSVLKRLNYLIGYLKKEMPEILPAFVTKLQKNFEQQLKTSLTTNQQLDLKEISKDFLHLKIYPDLLKPALDYFLQLLDYSSTKKWLSETIKIPNRNHIQSFLYHRYFNALTLTEILERNQAVRLFKSYIESYVKSLSAYGSKYDTLEDFRNARIPKEDDPPSIGWVIVQGKIENGKYPQRKDTCMWADAIDELPDVELRYLAACYGDFQGYNNCNENFILTMKHTVVEGHPYCDCITHDVRINSDLNHPSREFFDDLWSQKDK